MDTATASANEMKSALGEKHQPSQRSQQHPLPRQRPIPLQRSLHLRRQRMSPPRSLRPRERFARHHFRGVQQRDATWQEVLCLRNTFFSYFNKEARPCSQQKWTSSQPLSYPRQKRWNVWRTFNKSQNEPWSDEEHDDGNPDERCWHELPAIIKSVNEKTSNDAKTSEVIKNHNALGVRLDGILTHLRSRYGTPALPDFQKMLSFNLELIIKWLDALERNTAITTTSIVQITDDLTTRKSDENRD